MLSYFFSLAFDIIAFIITMRPFAGEAVVGLLYIKKPSNG